MLSPSYSRSFSPALRAALRQASLRNPTGGERTRGASLLEVLIAGTLFISVLGSIVPLCSMAIQSFRQASDSVDLQTRMESDMGMIRDLGERYSWCSGAGSVQPSGPTCSSSDPGNPAYYVPDNSVSGSSTTVSSQLQAFVSACQASGGTPPPLTGALIAAIASQPTPAGLSRVVSADGDNVHRLRIRYQGENFSRTLVYVPPLVAWCP